MDSSNGLDDHCWICKRLCREEDDVICAEEDGSIAHRACFDRSHADDDDPGMDEDGARSDYMDLEPI